MQIRLKPENFWRSATLALWVFAACILTFTVKDYGMSWDEITRWTSGDLKLDYYKTLGTEGLSAWGVPGSGDKYPGLYDLPLAIYHDIYGGDRMLAGHLLCIVFGLVSVVGVSLLGCRFGGWKTGFFAAIALLTLPRFYGHIFINPKDIPFAATYLLGVYGAIHLAFKLPSPKWRDWCLVGLLAGFAMATRLPGLIILAYLGLVIAWHLLGRYLGHVERGTSVFALIGGYTVSAVIAYVVLMIFFPASHLNPFSNSVKVVADLHGFSNGIPLLFRGAVIDAGQAPAYYSIWMLLITIPIVHLAFFVLGLALITYRSISNLSLEQFFSRNFVAWGVLLLACFFPLAYITIKQPAVHNGIRHLLFVLPTAAIIMAVGFVAITDYLKQTPLRLIMNIVFSLYLAYAASLLVRLHPYQYVYFNSIVGGSAGALGQYETEYWYTSTGEAVDLLQDWHAEKGNADNALVKVAATGPRQVTEYFLPDGWQWVANPEKADYFIGNTQFAGHLLGAGKTILTIERMELPIVYIKQVDAIVGSKSLLLDQ